MIKEDVKYSRTASTDHQVEKLPVANFEGRESLNDYFERHDPDWLPCVNEKLMLKETENLERCRLNVVMGVEHTLWKLEDNKPEFIYLDLDVSGMIIVTVQKKENQSNEVETPYNDKPKRKTTKQLRGAISNYGH